MNPRGIESLIDEWISLGLTPYEEVNGERVWKDCCVVEGMLGGATLPCECLVMGEDGESAYLKGTEPGTTHGRERKKTDEP